MKAMPGKQIVWPLTNQDDGDSQSSIQSPALATKPTKTKSRKDYQVRDKFFYAVPRLFPDWPYPSRLAIGMRFNDFKAINAEKFRFMVKDKLYEIEKNKAIALGNKYRLSFGSLPNLIPKEEFTEIGIINERE